jgi:CRP/FNR family transcriptional regulator, anaerobic regulatory protein
LASFFQQQPSEFHIIAIRKSNIKIIPQTTIVNLAQNNPQLLLAYNYLLQTLITQQMEREIDLLIDTPNERYQRVLTRSPQLFQEVPLKYIAAYLRMTPETLSRLRKS